MRRAEMSRELKDDKLFKAEAVAIKLIAALDSPASFAPGRHPLSLLLSPFPHSLLSSYLFLLCTCKDCVMLRAAR